MRRILPLLLVLLPLGGCGLAAAPCRVTSAALDIVPVVGHAAKPQPPRPAARRLSGRDQHALRLLPAQIEAFEAEIARLRQRLSDQDLYRRDPAGFAQASEALAAAEAGLASAEERWLELEMLREEIEA